MKTGTGGIQRQKSHQQLARRKLVVVGDGNTGKTSMLFVVSKGSYPEVHVSTILESEVIQITPIGKAMSPMELTVWDTAGQEDYDRLRPLSYPQTDVFIICFSVNNHNSYINVSEKWVPELKHFCPKTPIVLVATKADLRYDSQTHPKQQETISTMQGEEMAKKIEAQVYTECSAKDRASVLFTFQSAASVSLKNSPLRRRQQPCTLL